jgi:Ala-tRNA(Pro) deacylase
VNCREKLEAYLRDNVVAFQVQHHQLAYTAHKVAQSEHVSGKLIAKAVLVFADGALKMLVLPANHHVDFEKAAAAIGVREVRMASEQDFGPSFPDCEVGAEPAFGNLYDLPVYVDRALTWDETIITRAGTHTDTLSLTYADYERLVGPVVADFGRPG